MKVSYPDKGQFLKFFITSEQRQLLNLFITSLNTTYQHAVTQRGKTDEPGETQKEIETILKTTTSWKEAYRAEQLMIPLLSGPILHSVLSRQLMKAQRLGEEVAQYYSKQNETTESDIEKRELLRQLTQDLQWHDEVQRIKQNYIHRAWEIVSCAFFISFLFFFLPEIIRPLGDWLKNVGAGSGRGADIFTAITSGALGASFSMLISLRSRLEGSSLYTLKAMQKKGGDSKSMML